MDLSRLRPELYALTLASFATRLWRLFLPDTVVFDEIHFKGFAAHYLDGSYFFDVHPPLGKLLLAGYAHVIGLTPAAMLKGTAVGMRVLPAVCGALLVPVVWAILRRLGVGRPLAFLGAFLILADNAMLVEARFILMDSMLMLLGLTALLLYLVARPATGRVRWVWLSLSALCAGAAGSVKWTGLASLALVGLTWLWDQRREFRKKRTGRVSGELAVLALLPTLVCVIAFWFHFHLLPRTGPGDAFMTVEFQSTLLGSPTYNSAVHLSFPRQFFELNGAMLRANQTLTATHPNSSLWYSWPLELRSTHYWIGIPGPGGAQGNIYLLGNPVVWWGLWVALAFALWLLYKRPKPSKAKTRLSKVKTRLSKDARFALAVTGGAYAMNLLPFVEVSRVVFLYHYFFSFVFSIIFLVVLWDEIVTRAPGPKPAPRTVLIGVATVAVAVTIGFVFFAPVSYGLPLTKDGLQARMWLSSWR